MGPANTTLFNNKYQLHTALARPCYAFLDKTLILAVPPFNIIHLLRQRQNTLEYTMFGSSQDRARQLAGRHRKTRPRSSSSQWSRRSSASLTSQSQQQAQTDTALSDQPQHSPDQAGFYQYFQPIYGYDKRILGDPAPLSPSSLHAQPFQMDQHRVQNEYMSQILYGNHTLPNLLAPPPSHFMATSHPATYISTPLMIPPYHWVLPGLIGPRSSSFTYGPPIELTCPFRLAQITTYNTCPFTSAPGDMT